MRPVIIILALAGFTYSLFSPDPAPPTAEELHRGFMDHLHQGNYDSIPSILNSLYEGLNRNPQDAQLNADLGFVYLWQFSERGRKAPVAGIEKSIYLSNYYFREAIKYNPADPRLKGFQSATEICQGALSKDLDQIYRGYSDAYAAIKEWPQFNKFALSLVSSQLNKNSFFFRQAINYQWELIDDCSCKSLEKAEVLRSADKVFPELIRELEKTQDPLIKRACWNTTIAPHNFEGFLLNFGDMLVKQGNFDEAHTIYSAARLSPTFAEWAYRDVLEKRISEMKENRKAFVKRPELLVMTDDRQIFINSVLSCTGCHQMSKKEFSKSKGEELVTY
ncbi:MAG: hypothetical protein JWO09_3825 [Bacteroidetes bacterium]|nr:hypothetical protein [Bacteroidota bacterium]